MRATISLATLLRMSAYDLDVLFAACQPGPCPDGVYDGTVVLTATANTPSLTAWIQRWIWHGKTFDAAHASVSNRIPIIGGLFTATCSLRPSWRDQHDSYVLDYRHSALGRGLRDELRLAAPGLYLGLAYYHCYQRLHFALTARNNDDGHV